MQLKDKRKGFIMKQSNETIILDKIIAVANTYPANSALPIIFNDILKMNFVDMKGAKICIGKTYVSLYRKGSTLFVSKMKKRKEDKKIISNHILESGYYREQSLYHNGADKLERTQLHLKMIGFMRNEKKYINNVKVLLSHLKNQTNTDFLYEFDDKNMKLKELIFPIVEDAYTLYRLGYSYLNGSNAVEIIEEIIEKDNNFYLFSKAVLKNEIAFFKAKIKSNRRFISLGKNSFLP